MEINSRSGCVRGFFCTCEFELSANLASVEALDRSINNKKKGRASLEKKMRQNELPNVEKWKAEELRRARMSLTSVLWAPYPEH